MKYTRHGLSIGVERVNQECFLSVTIVGKLTHQDYESMVPMLESAIEGIDKPRIKVFIDARELEGWELHTAWDDLKMGIKHRTEFSKIAMVGNKKWQECVAKVSSWFIPGEVKTFDTVEEAMDWLEVS